MNKERKRKRRIFLLGSILLIMVFSICVIKQNQEEGILRTNAKIAVGEPNTNIESLSNKKIGWGIKRNDNHEQPDVGSVNKRILDQYEGICIGNKDKKYIYLTFDEGYEAGYTEKLLAILKQNDVKSTFFITAHYLNTQPDLVKRMIDEGHIIGNHTVNHKSMPDLNLDTMKKEVMDLHTAMYEKFGYEMNYIRPPKGEYSEKSVAYTNTLGYKTVMWSFAYDDWNEKKQGKEEYAKKKIMDNLHHGEVMLLHGNSKDNANILDEMIRKIKEEGYEFKSLNEFEE